MKRLIIMLGALMMLSGCSIGTVDDRLMVYAVGIDYEDGQYKASYQVFTPKGESASSPVNVDDSNVAVISATGESLEDCHEKLRLETGKDIFMKDTEVVVMGESVTVEQAVDIIEHFIASKEVYIGCGICFTNGKAEDAMNVGKGGTKDPHSLGEILRVAYSEGKCQSPRLVEAYNGLLWSSEREIPILGIEKDGEDNPFPKGVVDKKMIKR